MYIKIGDNNFKVIKNYAMKTINNEKQRYENGYASLSYFYARPSYTKMDIFEYWQEQLGYIRVTSANCFAFTIMTYYSIGHENYLLKITKSNNIAYYLGRY